MVHDNKSKATEHFVVSSSLADRSLAGMVTQVVVVARFPHCARRMQCRMMQYGRPLSTLGKQEGTQWEGRNARRRQPREGNKSRDAEFEVAEVADRTRGAQATTRVLT